MIDAPSFSPNSLPSVLDPTLVVALTCLLVTSVIVFALLRAWQDWLALKNRELDSLAAGVRPDRDNREVSVGSARIELADMKERIKKLEAIASGVEL
jgi:hypothetical protein